ncbi:FAD-dependent monooxygenase [Amycolatopsis sp. NPDC051903]|uniref:oxidoreductase n=1 Tax=Amycolatopsis sp. NPDC051903 TaxID=3363936 RepID=UPI0037B9F6C5
MRIAIVGGGPGGLYFAALAKQLDPSREVTVWERNAADDTFGFGVVFSDETLAGITNADPAVFSSMEREFARWSDIDVHYRGTVHTSGGHGFAAIARKRLLEILQRRCHDLGVDVRFRTKAPDVEELTAGYDLVIAADGVNSAVRKRFEDVFRPSLDVRECHYMWLATDRVLEAFTFLVEETEFGPIQVHAYPFSADRSTFIVEVNDRTWRRAGFTDGSFGPGVSDVASVERCGELLHRFLGDAQLLTNNSKWLRFTTVRNRTWRHGNLVLLGDAAHTAHYSIGSGTKLAMEDALALAAALEAAPGDLAAALEHYETERRPVVESTQRAAQASLEWFETIDHVVGQDPPQFAFNLLTRSRRVTYDNLKLRDPGYIGSLDRWFSEHTPGGRQDGTPPLFQPLVLAGRHLRNRVVAAPIATYSAVDGLPGEAELLHLSGKALGGAGLVLAGMTAVTAHGRVTPACPGLYTDEQTAAWRRITDTVHAHSGALVGVQLSHSGRKGSTAVPDSGSLGTALTANGWRTVAPSALAFGDLPVPHALTALQPLVEDFAAAARRADLAGFDVLELQAGHGFLLSTFLSPLTNHRTDRYGGDLEGRLRFPLAVVAAVRSVWPRYKPLLVRLSAVDWAEGGTTIEDSVRVAAALAEHGVDAIDVSSGEVVAHERPAYGRSYQTPFAERIRADVGIPTIAVGGISTCDDANSIVLAGRADLAAIGRAQLHDPSWALHAATELGYSGPGAYWPPTQAGGAAKPPSGGRARPLLTLRPAEPGLARSRWTPVTAATPDRSV